VEEALCFGWIDSIAKKGMLKANTNISPKENPKAIGASLIGTVWQN